MKIIVDNQILKMWVLDLLEEKKLSVLSDSADPLILRWPSLLMSLDLGDIFSKLPTFDEKNPLFQATVATLSETEEKEVVFHIFDQIFVENLNQIRSLSPIRGPFLLEAIHKKQTMFRPKKMMEKLYNALESYKIAFLHHSEETMHDLILYLAWDRMCVAMSRVFNYPSIDPKFLSSIRILKECLLESYQHISQQGRTKPGLFQLLQALFFYEMREENLPKHTSTEWEMFTRSFPALKAEEELIDFFYIDDAIFGGEEQEAESECSEVYVTLDSSNLVSLRTALAQYMVEKLKKEVPPWNYSLSAQKIVHLSI